MKTVYIGELNIGDTYKHITDTWGDEYVDYCSHAIFGGHVKIGFNLDEFIRRIND